MKKLIGYNVVSIPGNPGQEPLNGFTIFFSDSDVDVTDGTWCGSMFIRSSAITGSLSVGSDFEFILKPAKDQTGKTVYKVSGLVVV